MNKLVPTLGALATMSALSGVAAAPAFAATPGSGPDRPHQRRLPSCTCNYIDYS